jgi:hypothetical protein
MKINRIEFSDDGIAAICLEDGILLENYCRQYLIKRILAEKK